MEYLVLDTMRHENTQKFQDALNAYADLGYRMIGTVGTWVVMARKEPAA